MSYSRYTRSTVESIHSQGYTLASLGALCPTTQKDSQVRLFGSYPELHEIGEPNTHQYAQLPKQSHVSFQSPNTPLPSHIHYAMSYKPSHSYRSEPNQSL